MADRVPTGDDWQHEYDLIADDLRAALTSASPHTEDAQAAHTLARSLGYLGYVRRLFAESRRHYERGAAFADPDEQAAIDLQTAADVAIAEFRADLAFDFVIDAATRARGAGSPRVAAIALADAALAGARFPAEFPEEVPLDRLRAVLAEASELAPDGDQVVAAHCAAGLPDAEHRLAVAAPAGVESDWGAACLATARGRLHDDADALRESVQGWERIGARFERAVTLLLVPDRAAEGRAELAALGCALPGDVTPTT